LRKSSEPKRVLIFRPGHLGDTIAALPALWTLREAFPDASLALLFNVDSKNADLINLRTVLPEKGLIDEWLPYDHYEDQTASSRAAARLKMLLRIKRGKFDTLIYLTSRDRTVRQIERDAKFFRAAGIRELIGIEYLRKNCFEASQLPLSSRVSSESQFLLACLASYDIETSKVSVRDDLLALSGEERAKASRIVGEKFPEPERQNIVAVAPGAKRPSRRWSLTNFETAVTRLVQTRSVFPVVFGGSQDRSLGGQIIRVANTGLNVCGDLTVREAAALLGNCHMYLGNDTGTMHLAAAVGVPCVAIFSAADRPGQWEPFGQGHRFFRRHVECEGCRLDICDKNNLCLELIGVDEVVDACIHVLDEIRSNELREVALG